MVAELWRRNRQWFVPAVAALVAGGFAYLALTEWRDEVPAVVAARDVERLEQLGADAIRVARVPRSARHRLTLETPEQALGRFALQRLAEGEPLLAHHLSDRDAQSRLVASLAPGQRAMFVPTGPERGLGGSVRPGDSLDLIFVPEAGVTGAGAARTIVEGLPVLDVRQEPGDRGVDPTLAGVTVAVAPADAERIAWSLERGSIYLSLVGYADAGGRGETPAEVGSLSGGGGP